MKIAACLITKNSEETIERCVDSIRPFVDGIFVYDTGSEDSTVEILEKLNQSKTLNVSTATPDDPDASIDVPLAPIEVRRGDWRDDFAWARERSFEMPDDTYDFMLWLDDDDVVMGAENLCGLAASMPPTVDAYTFLYEYARDENGQVICVLWRERLIRRAAGYTWKGTVHEVLAPPEGRPAVFASVAPDMVRYVHDRPADRFPGDRNLRILRAEAEQAEREGRQLDPRTLAYLGTETMSQGSPEGYGEACVWFERYLEHPSPAWPDERSQVMHKLAQCLQNLGQPQASIEVEFRAIKERDDWAENYVGLAEGFAMLGDWPRVDRWARRAFELGMPQSPLILNPLVFTFIVLVRLSESAIHSGRYEDGQKLLEQAAKHAPSHPLIEAKRGEYQKVRYEGELVKAVLDVREALIRFDENWKAHMVLEHVPYVIQDHPAVVQARAAARENVRHAIDPAEYRRWYMEEPKESTVTDEMVPDATGFHRVAFLEHGLKEQEEELGRKPTLLDLGCNDFWMGAYFMSQGYDVDGVELNRRSYDLALERAKRFKKRGRPAPTIEHGDLHDADQLLDGKRYDAVSLFEVLEHVPDTDATMRACERLLNPGGRVYISTPDGAFENGRIERWSVVEPKGHLRAWPAWEFVDHVKERGSIQTFDRGQGLTVLSYLKRKPKGKVVFMAGGCFERWMPQQAMATGLGGSETALTQIATRLGLAGWNVKVYADVEEPHLGVGGVLWRPYTAWDPSEECDAMVISRIPAAFDLAMRAPIRALWCHDHSYPGQMTDERCDRMTDVIVLSDWEHDRYERLYPALEGKLQLIRNGITTAGLDGSARFPDGGRGFDDRKPRCVYASSADRGLDVLLDVWPRIRRQVPDAELHIYYGFDILDRAALQQPGLLEYKQQVLGLAQRAGGEDGGVFFRGRIGQAELAGELSDARVWSYPTGFLETSCIGAMEARAAGLAIVTSDLGAIPETVRGRGVLLPWDAKEDEQTNLTDGYQEEFVRNVVELLTDQAKWEAAHAAARADVTELDWKHRVSEWERLLRGARTRERAGRELVTA